MKHTIVALSAALITALGAAGFANDLEDQLKQAIDPALRDLLEGGRKRDAPAPSPAPAQPAQDAQGKPDAAGQPTLPTLGMSLEEEIKVGRQIAGNLLGAVPLVKDPGLQQYVNRVGRWVASQSTRPNLKWTFGVIDSEDINAFAAPGGYVFITRGLYARLGDEAELAGVLGHEIGHVQEKHHLKLLQQSQLLSLGRELLSRRIGPGDKTVQRLIGSGAEILARGLDKSSEFEADRIGVVLAARAGYDAWGLPSVLQDIGALGSADSSVALLFKTHPHPDERLTQLSAAMGERFDTYRSTGNLSGRLYKLKS